MTGLKSLADSAKELKKIRSLAAIAMLLALRVVLGMFANATLPLFGGTVKISGAFLPIAICGAMFGPIPAALVGALGDIISFLIAPGGAYIFGFTINGALTGLIYGFALYKDRVTIPRVIIGWMINMLAVETFLSAFWFYIFFNPGYETPYLTFLTTRFISVAVKCIPEILLIFGIGKLTARLDNRLNR